MYICIYMYVYIYVCIYMCIYICIYICLKSVLCDLNLNFRLFILYVGHNAAIPKKIQC